MSAFLDHVIKQGATQPALETQLTAAGSPVNLTGKTVTWRMRNQETKGAVAIAGTVSVLDAATGRVRYNFAAADTATMGVFEGEFVVATGGGAPDIFPDEGFTVVRITEPAA